MYDKTENSTLVWMFYELIFGEFTMKGRKITSLPYH